MSFTVRDRLITMLFLPPSLAKKYLWPVSNYLSRTLGDNYRHCYTAHYCHLVTCVCTTDRTHKYVLILDLRALNILPVLILTQVCIKSTYFLVKNEQTITTYNEKTAMLLGNDMQDYIAHVQQFLQIFNILL